MSKPEKKNATTLKHSHTHKHTHARMTSAASVRARRTFAAPEATLVQDGNYFMLHTMSSTPHKQRSSTDRQIYREPESERKKIEREANSPHSPCDFFPFVIANCATFQWQLSVANVIRSLLKQQGGEAGIRMHSTQKP